LINYAPDFVVNWIKIMVVRRPQIWRDECTCTEVSGVENIGQCGRLSQLSWLLGAL